MIYLIKTHSLYSVYPGGFMFTSFGLWFKAMSEISLGMLVFLRQLDLWI
jgi:hypothetical protein